ncbi:MAG: hypothetical protein WCA00_00130 [Candidatus Acidiferrales bacterium]
MKALRLLVVFALCSFPLVALQGQQSNHPITAQEIAAVKTAILDEIYDYEFEGGYVDIAPLASRGFMIRLYIRPSLDQGSGELIYKLPLGEVSRIFEIGEGVAVLAREPRDKFPPTSSSTLTLYLDDAVICADKKEWLHESLWISPHPSQAEVRAAVLRQRKRKGTSQHDQLGKRVE